MTTGKDKVSITNELAAIRQKKADEVDDHNLPMNIGKLGTKYYGVLPSENQLVIALNSFSFEKEKTPVYRAAPEVINLVQMLARPDFIKTSLPETSLKCIDPLVYGPAGK